MDIILIVAGVALLLFIGLSILGSVLNFAAGVMRVFLGFAILALVVTGVVWVMGGQVFPW